MVVALFARDSGNARSVYTHSQARKARSSWGHPVTLRSFAGSPRTGAAGQPSMWQIVAPALTVCPTCADMPVMVPLL